LVRLVRVFQSFILPSYCEEAYYFIACFEKNIFYLDILASDNKISPAAVFTFGVYAFVVLNYLADLVVSILTKFFLCAPSSLLTCI
jgi:hypothetical protein